MMQSSLLQAKLHRPAQAKATILRERLIRCLDEGLSCKVTLISAAAGYGKSTLLSSWLNHLTAQPQLPQAQKPVKAGWVTLDPDDNELSHFLGYFIAAIEESFPRSCIAVTSLLQERPAPTVERLADALTNALTLVPLRLVIVHRRAAPRSCSSISSALQSSAERQRLAGVPAELVCVTPQ